MVSRVGRGLDLFQEPNKPIADIQAAALGLFQDGVVTLALAQDLGGQAEESCRLTLVLGQRHVGDGAREPTVAVFERMPGDEP